MVKRHVKPTKENKGGIISKENYIHQSNVKNIDVKKTEPKKKVKIMLARLKDIYDKSIIPNLKQKLSYKNKHQVPKIEK